MSAGPTITSISPSSGTPSGGTKVSIAGSGLSTATDVQFGNVSAKSSLAITSDSLISVVTPGGGVISNVTLTVVTPQGNATWDEGFFYDASITAVSPASGSDRKSVV